MIRLRWPRPLLRLGLVAGLLSLASAEAARWPAATPAAPAALNRPADPVVLTGADLPALVGLAPAQIVGWRYSGGWQQIPVQVDERAVVDWGQIYNYGFNIGVTAPVYTDAATWTGADSDAAFDANDELALMAADSGAAAPAGSAPAGVVAASGIALTITDPLVAGSAGYVYLFQQAGGLDSGAGQQYVSYTFNLISGDYKATYHIQSGGPNSENSTASSPFYQTHFADRWINDELRLGAGVDILDRHKVRFTPNDCTRSEDTFANGVSPFPVGAFIANKAGPVRAIRAFIGANSGPLTQREHILYARRQDIRTSLRVHAIPGIMDFYDYSAAASGLTYRNDLNPAGVVVDGQPDAPAAGPIQWEQVSGADGSVSIAHHITTDIPNFAYTSYYTDTVTPTNPQCTGDTAAYGASGVWVNQPIPCTDQLPSSLGGSCPTSYRTLATRRTLFYDGPNQPAAVAAQHYAELAQPLTYTVAPWPAATTPTATATLSATPSSTATTPSPTATATLSASPTAAAASPTTPAASPTASPSATIIPSPTASPRATVGASATAVAPTASPTVTAPAASPTASPRATVGASPTMTPSLSATPRPTAQATPTATAAPGSSATPSSTALAASPTATAPPSPTAPAQPPQIVRLPLVVR